MVSLCGSKTRILFCLLAAVGLFAFFFVEWNQTAFTLYRNSVMDESTRIHVATFDASDGHKYNMENCDIARSLFGTQQGVRVRYWCEKGRFNK